MTWRIVLLCAATLLAYFPALQGELLWDDAAHITAPELRSVAGLGRIWFDLGATQQYYPVLHSAFWLEHRAWGDAVLGYHLANVGLHVLASALLGILLARLRVPGAWFAASLFALHPVAVESVAWISEQKNTLSAVFYFGAALAYLAFASSRRRWNYALASGLFALALLSKSVTATLPAALLVVLWWRERRSLTARDVVPLLPWFAASLAMGLFTAGVERDYIGATGDDFDLSLVDRTLIAGHAVWFYLGKLFWPAELLFVYPRWEIDASAAWQYAFPLSATVALAVIWWRGLRGLLAGSLLFLGTLFPALGFLNVYPFLYSFVADHFQYLAAAAIYALVAAGGARLVLRLPHWCQHTLAVTVLAILTMLTWRQSHHYRNPIALFESVLTRNPDCWMAHHNLAQELARLGREADALPHLARALELRPTMHQAENNWGDNLRRLGRPLEALPHFQRALELRPAFPEAWNNLGLALIDLDRPAAALAALDRSLQIEPTSAETHNNRGVALVACDRTDEGILAFRRALELAPRYAAAHRNLGLALARRNQLPEAIHHLEEALALEPTQSSWALSLAAARLKAGSIDQSIATYQRIIAAHPDLAAAHAGLGRAYSEAGQFERAVSAYEQALAIQPDDASAHQGIAYALAQLGRTAEAMAHRREAEQSSP